ncbi:carbohydrate-binding module family 50 protein [Phycomyces blakesleeanus]|uniref:Carbohydrate-binding module family 50 protein n=2 Tax=Phycomyces blakesleeanus TaxID=4837 RepID=A0A162UNG2_PHYB8|nr:carbohydrate-binding module family 50 protein [Phycomyces blakesleeanus NRRL 1555(-)]OAD77182.1 carbohydrate-binding module family 50 protein [Phycomyces blakesleeanus NRRL 1555(-)]|eukprot:XP_018295222.1 carbohydrate-binding module family 50 protein [Phycomyces blakesleeanus NRRL 1555(-)]
MKFTLIATATMALVGMVSAIHPIHSCTLLHTASSGESCKALAQKYNVSVEDLRSWNHGLTNSSEDRCLNLFPGVPYCVLASDPKVKRTLFAKRAAKTTKKSAKKTTKKAKKTTKKAKKTTKKAAKKTTKKAKSPKKASLNIANRTDPNCKKYHVVKSTDSCYSVAKVNNISLNKFYSLNLGLHHLGDHICDNLDTGKAYCVAV